MEFFEGAPEFTDLTVVEDDPLLPLRLIDVPLSRRLLTPGQPANRPTGQPANRPTGRRRSVLD
jgi:hypothetical protein